MTKPTKTLVDCSTGVVAEVELTDEEIAQREAEAIFFAELKAQRLAEAEAKEQAKNSALSKLAELGITEEEVKSLLG